MVGLNRGAGRYLGRVMLQAMLGWLLLVACAGAFAASPRSLRFERIGVEQGLSQESVLNILQDRQGFMWFGTQAGLNRFDGYRMTVFRNDPDKPGSIPDNFVTASYQDAAGRLWFGTKGGLTRYDPPSQKFVRYLPGAPGLAAAGNRAVSAILPDGSGGLWLATGNGLQHFDPVSGEFSAMRHDPHDPGSLTDDRVSALAMDGQGALWVGTAAGLDRLARGATRFEHFRIAPLDDRRRNNILALSMGPRETLWIGTAAGLESWRLDEAAPRRHHVGLDEGLGDVRILTLYHDAGTTLWVGTDLDGLKWRDPASGHFVSYRNVPLDPHSLSDNQVGAVWVDRTGTLWAGTLFGGVNRVDLASGGFTRFTHTPGLSGGIGNNRVRAMIGDGSGRLWIGSTGGLALFDPASGQAQYFRRDPQRADSLPDDIVTSLAMAGGRLWVGTAGGLAWRDPAGARFTVVNLGADPAANYIQSLRTGRDGTLWVVTRGGLFALGAGGQLLRSWRHDPQDPASLGENFGYALLEDRKGTIWVGTDNGLERFDRASGSFTHYRHDPLDPDSLRHSRVYYLFESARGELWVGTAGGLHRMETGPGGKTRFRQFRISNAREALSIGAVLEDAGGALWVSTAAGISRLDPVSGNFKSYNAEDGLLDGSYFVGAAWAAPDGELFFGGVNGMTAFMPAAIRDNPYSPTVLITDFLVFNRPLSLQVPVHEARDITLSYRDAAFSLEFAALHYADPHANRYAYRLEGFDPGWVDTDAGKRFATYTNLDPGRYVFRVRASNKDGVWGELASLAITITPPFWKTWWFRLLAAALGLGAVYAGYRLRVRALVEHKNSLERQVGMRTAELVLQKEAAERRKREVEQQKEVVEQAHRNISRLSDIGRKLTANLDTEAISATLYEHLHALMDAGVFGIGIHQPERAVIAWPFVVLDGVRCAPLERALAAPDRLAAWCIANGREVFVGDLDTESGNYLDNAPAAAAGQMALPCSGQTALVPRALLMVPIVVGARVLGVVTVQSFARHAYQRVHLDMLRTLAAYVGVALDNADAYRQLKDTQAQLAARDKLASLGSLVAGVAHELNTPIGNSLLMASTLQETTTTMSARFDAATLRRSDLAGWIASSQEASHLIVRSLNSAADLVNSFRQVAVDQASAQRRRFDLAQACQEIAATMMKQVRLAGHRLEIEVPAGIVMDSFPGPFGQLVINFVNNALLHAFDAPGGQMTLSATTPEHGRVRIVFRDDGRGIDPEHLGRIFEPFFTTRMGRGGTGLGLNIAWNIVTTLLGGAIMAESQPGNGAVFILDLPLVVPEPALSVNH